LRSLGLDTRLGFDIGVTFSVELASGTMRGRFDWPVFPNGELGPDFVRALQAALDEQGADLAVDGIWGPRTSTALTKFAQQNGITEPVVRNGEPSLNTALFTTWWLLGLPPADVPINYLAAGDTEVASQSPAAVTEQHVILRPDGLARFDFGESAAELVSELETLLGPPSDDTSYTPDGPGPFDFLPLGYWAAYELRIVAWDEPDLRLVLSDVPFRGDHWDTATPGSATLVSWQTSSDWFALDTGVKVGATLAELRSA
jgi:hypothetical protein